MEPLFERVYKLREQQDRGISSIGGPDESVLDIRNFQQITPEKRNCAAEKCSATSASSAVFFFVVYLLIFLCFFVSFSSVAIAVSLVFNLSGSRGPIYVGLTCFQSDHDSLLWGSRILILQILYLQKEKVRTRETIDLGSHDCSIYLI